MVETKTEEKPNQIKIKNKKITTLILVHRSGFFLKLKTLSPRQGVFPMYFWKYIEILSSGKWKELKANLIRYITILTYRKMIHSKKRKE